VAFAAFLPLSLFLEGTGRAFGLLTRFVNWVRTITVHVPFVGGELSAVCLVFGVDSLTWGEHISQSLQSMYEVALLAVLLLLVFRYVVYFPPDRCAGVPVIVVMGRHDEGERVPT
jgi:hypothetical protein